MSGNVHRRPAVSQDLVGAIAYLAERSEAAARRFRTEAEATFQRLAGMPGLGTRYQPDDPASDELRFFPVSRFSKYLVFYRPVADGIEVVRVLHGARDIGAILATDLACRRKVMTAAERGRYDTILCRGMKEKSRARPSSPGLIIPVDPTPRVCTR
jgi:toxin ParE1/3/4